MSDNSAQHASPMIAATAYLRPPPAVIGRLGQHITLPRTVQIRTIGASGVGAVVGALVTLPIPGLPVFQKLAIGCVLGAFMAIVLMNYQPLKGESFARWAGLVYQNRNRPLMKNGERVRPAIGIALISRTPQGSTWVVRSAVNIPPSQWDERGVKISSRNRNLDRAVSPRLVPEALERPISASAVVSLAAAAEVGSTHGLSETHPVSLAAAAALITPVDPEL